MTHYFRSIAVGIIFLSVLGSSQAHLREPPAGQTLESTFLNEKIPVPPGVRTHLSLTKPSYVLGEPIPLRYVIENTGDTPFSYDYGGDYGAGRELRYTVSVRDADGRQVPLRLWTGGMGGGLGGTITVAPHDSHGRNLDLTRYCQIDRPGVYTVRVREAIGWRTTAPEAAIELTLTEPTPEEMETVLDALTKAADSPERAGYDDFNSDFNWIRAPIYLPLLLKRARLGDKNVVVGIGSIATPEATSNLVELMDSPDATVAAKAETILYDRLPVAAGERILTDPELLESSAKSAAPELAPTIRAHARALLQHDNLSVNRGANLLSRIGTADDLPALTQALTVAIQRMKTVPTSISMDDEPPYFPLTEATNALAARGIHVPFPPKTAGEQTAFLQALQVDACNKAFRESPAQIALHISLLSSKNLVVRVVAWDAIPKTPPSTMVPFLRIHIPALLRDSEPLIRAKGCELAATLNESKWATQIRQIAMRDPEYAVSTSAEEALVHFGGRTAYYELWVDKMDDTTSTDLQNVGTQDITFHLSELFAYHEMGGGRSSRKYSDDEIHALQNRWRTFLHAHRKEIDAGRKWKLTDPDMPYYLIEPYITLK